MAAAPLVHSTPPFEGKKVLIQTEYLKGCGDVSCAFKVAAIVHKHFNIPAENIVVCILRAVPDVVARINTYPFPVLFETPRDKKIACALLVPYTYKCYSEIHSIFSESIAFLGILEYGFSNDIASNPFIKNLYAMGLSKKEGEIGIFLSDELVSWGFSEKSHLSLNRIARCEELSSSIKRSLFKTDSPTREDFTTFDIATRLYYGYAHRLETLIAYISAVAKIDQEKLPAKHIIVVFPVHEPYMRYDILYNEFLKASLSSSGIGKLIIETASDRQEVLCNEDFKKQITLLLYSIPFKDVQILLQASEKESVVTGDQSLSETISANKNFGYEDPGHKATVAEALREIFHTHAGDFDFNINLAFNGSIECIANQLFEIFRNGQSHPEIFSVFNQFIVENHDCRLRICQSVENVMLKTIRDCNEITDEKIDS